MNLVLLLISLNFSFSSTINMKTIDTIIEENDLYDLNKVPALLPTELRTNFILKHGQEQIAPRGHLFEIPTFGKGQGATPLSPRAILFDENSGFSISYNGGGEICQTQKTVDSNGSLIEIDTEIDPTGHCATTSQKNGHTLDMMEFDKQTGFHLWKWDLNGSSRSKNNKDCQSCHGPHNRPIFSMYPDWPGFYGSDNDELTNPNMKIRGAGYDATVLVDQNYQEKEFDHFMKFRKQQKNHPRYAPLFQEEQVKSFLSYGKLTQVEPGRVRAGRVWNFSEDDKGRVYGGISGSRARGPGEVTKYPWDYLFRLFPFRPAHTLTSTRDVSRAFRFRAGLRFNILMSRYHTLNLARIIKSHPNFDKFGKFFVYNLMRCQPSGSQSQARLREFYSQAGDYLSSSKVLPAGDRRRQLDLQSGTGFVQARPLVGDGETGFVHSRSGAKNRFLEYERAWLLFDLELRDIDMRYSYQKQEYDYVQFPTQGPMKIGYFGSYFNAYNDGSTTTDELMAAQLLQHLVNTDKIVNKNIEKASRQIQWSYQEKFIRQNKEVTKTTKKTFFDNQGTRRISDDRLQFWGFVQKYGRFPGRYQYDQEFFEKMDSLAMWINLPYAPEIAGDHHRAPWWIKRTKHFSDVYNSVCKGLEESL